MDSRLQTGKMRFLKASRVCRKCGSMHCVRCALPLLGEGSTMPSMVLADLWSSSLRAPHGCRHMTVRPGFEPRAR